MKQKQPLVFRLYTDPRLFELVRIVGYRGAALEGDVEQRIHELGRQYGKPAMQAAADEVLVVDGAQKPPSLRLRPEVVKICWQLLGPPPEQWEAFYANCTDPPPNPYLKAEAPAERKPRRRKKAS